MEPQCVVCGATSSTPLYKSLLRCERCGHVFADISLTDEELAALYSRSFFTEGDFIDYPGDEKFFTKNFRARRQVLRRFVKPEQHERLLEIGSAYGFFLDVVRNDFRSVEGIDITDEGVRHARESLKLAVVQGDFLQHDYGDRVFDVVCMWDTIEHLRRPDLYVSKIAAHTEPGALLALTTGDVTSLNARLRGANWRLIIPPAHLHYFSTRTLTSMLDAYGFDVIYHRYCGFHRSVRNMAYIVLASRHNKRALFDKLDRTGFLNWGFSLNLYDIMYVIARKR